MRESALRARETGVVKTTGNRTRRALQAQLGPSIQLRVVQEPRGLPTHWESDLQDCACTAVNDVGKPCAREPHARFERGPLGRLIYFTDTAGLGPVRRKATTMVWSRPEPQQWLVEPVAYLTNCRQPGDGAFGTNAPPKQVLAIDEVCEGNTLKFGQLPTGTWKGFTGARTKSR
jgi:hypothetical protein